MIRGKKRATAARLKQPVTGPDGKKYFVSEHRDRFGYAKKFNENVYKEDRDVYNYDGMFITPDANEVIIVDKGNYDRWRRPFTKQEGNAARAYLQEYRKEYGADATPQKKFNQMHANKMKHREQTRAQQQSRAHQGGSEQNKRVVVMGPRPPPPPPAAAVQRPHVPPAVVYPQRTPQQVRADQEKALLQKKNIKILNHDHYLEFENHPLIKACYNNLVKVAKLYDNSPVKFPDEKQLESYHLKSFLDHVRDFILKGKNTERINHLNPDFSTWEYLICIAQKESPDSLIGKLDEYTSLKLWDLLLANPGELQNKARPYGGYTIAFVNDLRNMFQFVATYTLNKLAYYSNARREIERKRLAAAQADHITKQDSAGNEEVAIKQYAERVRVDDSTPVLPSVAAREEFYRILFLVNREMHPIEDSAGDALYHIVRSGVMNSENFKKCMFVSYEFLTAWQKYGQSSKFRAFV